MYDMQNTINVWNIKSHRWNAKDLMNILDVCFLLLFFFFFSFVQLDVNSIEAMN